MTLQHTAPPLFAEIEEHQYSKDSPKFYAVSLSYLPPTYGTRPRPWLLYWNTTHKRNKTPESDPFHIWSDYENMYGNTLYKNRSVALFTDRQAAIDAAWRAYYNNEDWQDRVAEVESGGKP